MFRGLPAKRLFVLVIGFMAVNGSGLKMAVHGEEEGKEVMTKVKEEKIENGFPRVYVQVEDESGANNSDVEVNVERTNYSHDEAEERKEEKYKHKNKSLRGVKVDNGKKSEDNNVQDEDGDVDTFGNNKYNKGNVGNKRTAKSIKKSRFSMNKYL